MNKNYSSLRMRKLIKTFVYHLFVIIFGVVMVYPLLWMIFSSFKPTNTIFSTAGKLIPNEWTWNNYITGWKGFGNISFAQFFRNSFYISITATVGAVLSSALVAYGFARLRFHGRKILFCAMLVTLMLPAQIMMIPQYLWYQKLNWVGTYQPLIIPYFFATQGFFVYLIQNFISGVPRELDEAAKIDGCSYYFHTDYFAVDSACFDYIIDLFIYLALGRFPFCTSLCESIGNVSSQLGVKAILRSYYFIRLWSNVRNVHAICYSSDVNIYFYVKIFG